MPDNRVKVVGYAKREFFDGGIEYRNFSDSLVGNQFTTDGGTTLFTTGNFKITTNTDPKANKIFNTAEFGEFVSLDDLKLSNEVAVSLIEDTYRVKLNIDTSELTNYAYFGSLREFVRVSLENIILNWPAALYVSPIDEFNPSSTGATFENYVYNPVEGYSTYRIDVRRLINKFGINFLSNGLILNNFTNVSELRNLSINYTNYVVSNANGDFDVLGFTGSSNQYSGYVYLQVKGNPFDGALANQIYHIKPNAVQVEGFFSGLNSFEDTLLNRFSVPKYTSNFKFSVESEEGNIIETDMTVTWPVSDGYNIDFDSENYLDFVNNLLQIADGNDLTKTNLMTRFLVSESITEFDTLPSNEENYGQKMASTLKIYGREFDEVKKFIDGISFANVVSYDKKDNAPDLTIKNLAKVMGWELTSSITELDLLSNYLTTESSFSGHSRGLSPSEAEVELWRRLLMNTPWLWKSKGTRKAIEFLFRFIGTPNGLMAFNEYIYVAKDKFDIELFKDILEEITGSRSLDEISIDSEGYPRFLEDTLDMYFQKAGLWYRETGGPNSNIDILTGNNPHVGPYDGGQEYFNQLACLIGDFEPVTLIEERTVTETTNLFTNYNDGKFDGVFDNDVVAVINTNIDFSGMLSSQIFQCINGLDIRPDFSGCSATTEWILTAYMDSTEVYSSPFGNTQIVNGQIIGAASLKNDFINELDNVTLALSNNYYPLTGVTGVNNYTFLEPLETCDDNSYYKDKNLRVELCLNIDYDCAGGDCEPGSLIITGIDEATGLVYISNVTDNTVPASECCTNLGFIASAVTGGYKCYEQPEPITNNTNIYAYFDTTSMSFQDAQAAYTALTAWFATIPDTYPSYSGNLYTIPCGDENWLRNSTRPWTGVITGITTSAPWSQIYNPPPAGGQDGEVIILHFVDETNPNYHGAQAANGFTNPVQPTPLFRNDYGLFMTVYPNYTFFRSLVYPVVRQVTGEGGALVIQALAAIEGTTIPPSQYPTTNVDISILSTQNPYQNATYSGGTMIGLKNFGFQGKYDKQSPASAVFNSATFANDLNEFLNNG